MVQGKNTFWAHYAFHVFKLPLDVIINCHIDSTDLTYAMFNNHKSFWFDVWKAWAAYSFHKINVQSACIILNHVLWYNSEIKIQDKCVLLKSWYNKGICYISDIFSNVTKQLLSFQDLMDQFDLPPTQYFRYVQLCSAIPSSWINKLKSCANDTVMCDYKNVYVTTLFNKNCSRSIYWDQVNNLGYTDNSRKKWELEFKKEIVSAEWSSILGAPFVTTMCTKLRYFQYRLLAGKLTTNVLRAKWDPGISPLCFFCGNCYETVVHVLWECSYVKKLWKTLERWLNYILSTKILFDCELVIFSNYTGQFKNLVNTILLIVKQAIYAAKCTKTKITCNQLISRIYMYNQIERIIAHKTDMKTKYYVKWSHVAHSLRFEICDLTTVLLCHLLNAFKVLPLFTC